MDTISTIWAPGYHLPATIAASCGKRIRAFVAPDMPVLADASRQPFTADAHQTVIRPSALPRGT